MIQTVGLIINKDKKGSAELLGVLTEWLSKRDSRVLSSQSESIDQILKEADLILPVPMPQLRLALSPTSSVAQS